MERFAEWLWRRWRSRYVVVVSATMALVSLFVYVPFVGAIIGAFFGLRVGLISAVITAVANAVLLPMVFLWPSPDLDVLRSWIGGDRSDPAAALRASFGYARRALRFGPPMIGSVYLLIMLPAQAWFADLTQSEAMAVGLFNFCGVLTSTSLFRAAGDLFLRPPRTEMAAALDGSPANIPVYASAAGRLDWVGFSFATTVGTAASAVVIQFDTAAARFAAGLLAAMGAAAVLGRTTWHPLALVPTMRPIGDLTATARRIGSGDYTHALEVTSDDDLGELVEAVNDMQRGLTQREQLRSAFGTYVDPALTERLLEQGNDTFQGERIDVTVLFVDIRDFTPFAEANSAEDTVAHLNALFEIVVPIVGERGGHVNKFLGDGAMAVFGAPNRLDGHADAAVSAAVEMQRRVHDRFGGSLRIGIGVNTGPVIAGTIGGAGKLEYTLIGDTVNVAARVEATTKTTGDQILLTEQTVGTLTDVYEDLVERGDHALKGKSQAMDLYGLNPI